MDYAKRLMKAQRNKIASPDDATCAPSECRQMFGVIAGGLDDLKSAVADVRSDIGAVNERLATQEAKTHSVWHSISRIEKRVTQIPRDNVEDIARHEASCAGRDYVRIQLEKGTGPASIPQPASSDRTSFRISDVGAIMSGARVPKWIVYIGAGIGVAAAASGYLLNVFGVL